MSPLLLRVIQPLLRSTAYRPKPKSPVLVDKRKAPKSPGEPTFTFVKANTWYQPQTWQSDSVTDRVSRQNFINSLKLSVHTIKSLTTDPNLPTESSTTRVVQMKTTKLAFSPGKRVKQEFSAVADVRGPPFSSSTPVPSATAKGAQRVPWSLTHSFARLLIDAEWAMGTACALWAQSVAMGGYLILIESSCNSNQREHTGGVV